MGDEEVAEESCESAAKPAKKAEKKPAKKPVKKATASDDEEEGGEEGGEEVDDADFGDDEEDAEDASESSVQAGTTKINTLKLFKGDQADAYTKLDVSFSASVNGKPLWTAFYAGKPVATARVENVGKNQDLFDKPAFGQAVLAGAKHAGVKKILLDMGFKPIVHKLSVSAEVKRMVEKQIAKERTAIASGQSEYAERYCAALATAAIGINRGFFSGIKNPLKQALCGSLESIGVRNPAQLVDNVMKTNFEPFQKAAHEKALEILGKPAEVQQSLAKTVLETEYQAASESSSTLEDKLSSLGTAHPAAPVHESKSATVIDFNQDLSLAVGTLGKR